MRILFTILIATFIVSCNKELPDDFVPYNASLQIDTVWKLNPPTTAPSNDLLDIFTDHVSIQGFYADTGGTFKMNDSLQIEVPANALLKNGSPVVGLVSVNISQYRTKGQLIAANISTLNNSNSQTLETIGAFNVQFYKNSDLLTLAPGKKYTLKAKSLSGNVLTNIFPYYQSQNAGIQTNWAPATDGSGATINTAGSEPTYLLQMAGMGWLTAGKLADATGAEKIRLNAILPISFTNSNTIAFAVFKEQNVVVRLHPDVASKSFYTEGIPAGKQIKVITLSKLGDQYYLGIAEATATKGSIIKVAPEKKTSAKDIVSIILNL
jgi:hypothetical protein